MLIKDEIQTEKKQKTFTELLRVSFKPLLDGIGESLHRIGIKPNWITIACLTGAVVGAFLIARGYLLAASLVILGTGVFDAFDGAVARASGQVSDYGAFLDSVLDRYGESAILFGFGWYFTEGGQPLGVVLAFAALIGSLMVSYTRARAEGLGIETRVGILTRVERIVVVGFGLLFGYPLAAVLVVAVLANLTAFQRIYDVRRITRSGEEEK